MIITAGLKPTITIGTTVRYIGWLPDGQSAFVGIVRCKSGVSLLLDVDGTQKWVDGKNVERIQ